MSGWPTKVRIVLDTGAFLPEQTPGQTYIDVGYFETQDPSDIIVHADGNQVPLPPIRLGTGNQRISIDHLAADGSTKAGTTRTPSFDRDLLRKRELFGANTPDFKTGAFDCILRFSSGDFDSADPRPHQFKECRVADGSPTGRVQTTRPIASDIVVDYDLDQREALKISRGGDEVLSTDKIAPGAKRIEIRVINDISTVPKYLIQALDHQGPYCWLSNPDPPPVNE